MICISPFKLSPYYLNNYDFSHILIVEIPFILDIGNRLIMRYFLLFAFVFTLISCSEQGQRIFPQKSRLTESVYASATIQPDSLYNAYAVVAGILDKNLVAEGDKVLKGESLVHINNNAPKLNTANARLALELAQENFSGKAAVLRSLEDEIHAAELTFYNDSINYYRQKRLWDQKIGSKVEYDNRLLAYELAKNKLNLLKANYGRSKKELETQLRQARNTYNASQINSGDFTVTSKINGTVYALFKEPGEIVTTLEPLASVGSSTVFVIELLVDEVDIVKLELGQKALITMDAYPQEVFVAKISKIYPRKDERSQTFMVEAVFEQAPKTLYPGLSGEGNIIISEKDGALTIPKEFLLNGNQVLTQDGTVDVMVGLQNLDRVEILQGIDESTQLIKPEE